VRWVRWCWKSSSGAGAGHALTGARARLFQADCHPGNILVRDNGIVGAAVMRASCKAQQQMCRVCQETAFCELLLSAYSSCSGHAPPRWHKHWRMRVCDMPACVSVPSASRVLAPDIGGRALMRSSAGRPLAVKGTGALRMPAHDWQLRGAGLLDYGQAKQLANSQRLAFAWLVVALSAAADAPLLGVLDALSPSQQARRGSPPSPSQVVPRGRSACGAASVPQSAALHAPLVCAA